MRGFIILQTCSCVSVYATGHDVHEDLVGYAEDEAVGEGEGVHIEQDHAHEIDACCTPACPISSQTF